MSLDQILENETPTLLNIDVEGCEKPVLDGARYILKKERVKAVIMELNGSGEHYGFSKAKILDDMKALGLGCFTYNPLTRELADLEGKNLDEGSTLFVRDTEYERHRVEGAPSVTVNGTSF